MSRGSAQWAPDPFGRHDLRYWDGQQWSEQVADCGRLGIDPPVEELGDLGMGGTDLRGREPGAPSSPGHGRSGACGRERRRGHLVLVR
jgi:hypothetical protein